MKCVIEDCQQNSCGKLWDGKPYCSLHYNELMSNELEREWSRWEDNMPPSSRLLYICGRYLDEKKWTSKNGLMTSARLRNRGFNFQKEDIGFTFEITRHPYAWKNSEYVPINRCVEKWRVSLQDGLFELIKNREWTQNDPDMD